MVRRSVGVVLMSALLGAGGCQSMDREELAWRALHAVDVAQTLNAASDPCYEEHAWLTRQLIGRQPSDAEVIVWGVGIALAHGWISRALESNDAPRWVQATWSIGTVLSTGYTVVDNHRNGVRPWGDNLDHNDCHSR